MKNGLLLAYCVFTTLIYLCKCFHNSTQLHESDFLNGVVMDRENYINGTWFLKFYLPSCKYCQRMAEEWELLANETFGMNFTVGSVDCSEYRNACERFDVGQYPTLFVLENNTAYEFKGQRSLENFKDFVLNHKYRVIGTQHNIIHFDDIPITKLGRAMKDLSRIVTFIFDKLSLDWVPFFVQVFFIASFICSPLIVFAVAYCCLSEKMKTYPKSKLAKYKVTNKVD